MLNRKIMIMSIILTFALTGCGKAALPAAQNAVSEESAAIAVDKANTLNTDNTSNTASLQLQLGTKVEQNTKQNAVPKVNGSSGSKDAGDREALLNEVSQELDTLSAEVNNLDDVQASDMN